MSKPDNVDRSVDFLRKLRGYTVEDVDSANLPF